MVKRAGKIITLTPKEFSVLELLLHHKDEVVSRTMIIEHVWDYNFDSMSNVVDVFIAAIRRKVDKGAKYSIEDVSSFPIANAAVTDVRRTLKNTIQLDTNIQIKLDFINPESAEKFVEKGWDEEKQMYYYLVYFNKEQKS